MDLPPAEEASWSVALRSTPCPVHKLKELSGYPQGALAKSAKKDKKKKKAQPVDDDDDEAPPVQAAVEVVGDDEWPEDDKKAKKGKKGKAVSPQARAPAINDLSLTSPVPPPCYSRIHPGQVQEEGCC